MLISLPASSAARRFAVGCGASSLCILLTGIIVRAQDPAITATAPAAPAKTTKAVQPPAVALSAADMAPPTTLPGTLPLGAAGPQGPPLIELYFKDVPIVDLLDMIARQGDIGVV